MESNDSAILGSLESKIRSKIEEHPFRHWKECGLTHQAEISSSTIQALIQGRQFVLVQNLLKVIANHVIEQKAIAALVEYRRDEAAATSEAAFKKFCERRDS